MNASETILVTGGCGFIGANFVRGWLGQHPENRVVVLDKLTYASDPRHLADLDRAELVHGDINNRELLVHLLDRHKIGRIVHFAAESHVDNSITGPGAFIQTNVVGTFNLLEAARECWAGDKDVRFLHVSTDEVFGALGPVGRFHEQMPYAPNSPYSASKAGSDHLVRAYFQTFGLPAMTTHCSNNYGPRQHAEKLIPLAILRMRSGEPVPIYGDGRQIRDWLHVEDHCAAIERVMDQGVPGETYCIGGGNERQNIELLTMLGDEVDRQLGRAPGTSRKLHTYVKDRPGHDRRYAIDAGKIQSHLGWQPKVEFAAGLSGTVTWYLQRFPARK